MESLGESFDELAQLTPGEMTPEQFSRWALILPVRKAEPGQRVRLEVAPGAEAVAVDVRKELESALGKPGLTGGDRAVLASSALTELLSVPWKDTDQVWTTRPAGGRQIVIVLERVFARVGARRVLEAVHRTEVDEALRRSLPVRPSVVSYYRGQSAQGASLGNGG